MKDETKLFYDLTAEKTADEWYKNDILLPTIKEFVSFLPEGPKILDLGCGTGHETKRLAFAGAEVTGIDYSSECIRVAKKRCPECKFEIMDFRNLDDRLGKFDGVFASGSLIHIKPHELPSVISVISRIFKKGGCFLVIVQDGEGINEKWSTLEIDGKTLRRTVYCYTKDYLIGVALKSGLEFIREGYLDKCLYEQNWRSYIFKRI
ncbi:MAG: methyltransferase domain-containing protein [Candidatus Omnitrophica bacterium]|nr:methyltransferase domain-containing protein [Candidatus Omnitrophota bacterium]